MAVQRAHGRSPEQVRDIHVTFDAYGYAAASVLFQLGNTKVLCTVDLQQGVPPFLRGQKTGWLKAEYAMLPTATTVRNPRESFSCKKNGRLIEISRLIGRSLRIMVNLDALGEQTINVDCDVLQADGGTRTACITGASLALQLAAHRWYAQGKVGDGLLVDTIAAVSVGIRKGNVLVDLDFAEDESIDADFNFVMTRAGSIVEIQGTAEHKPLLWDQFTRMSTSAQQSIQHIFTILEPMMPSRSQHTSPREEKNTSSIFSLASRTMIKRKQDGSFELP